jgi:hypothetical protein
LSKKFHRENIQNAKNDDFIFELVISKLLRIINMVLQEQKLAARIDDNEKKKDDEPKAQAPKSKDTRDEKDDMVSIR